MTVFKHGDRVKQWMNVATPHTTGTVTGTTPEGRVLVRWDDNHAITEQVPHYLEPLGEPMSTPPDFFAEPGSHNPETKTFNSALGHGRVLEVQKVTGKVNLVIRKGPERLNSYIGISLEPADIPGLALAILESAGIEACAVAAYNPGTDIYLSSIAGALTEHIKATEAKAKEAADREELVAEALELRNVLFDKKVNGWEDLVSAAEEKWIAVAKHARTFRGVKA